MMQHQQPITRLTALWALSESGLGGVMHALKIPFTGFFLGGFAIVIIALIAQLSEQKFTTIIKATALVILIKAAASPHSPPMAYIAVGFQGLAGAVLFSTIPYRYLASILFGGIALLESAAQKFLVATLLFGKSIWEALDAFVAGILKDLSVFADFSFSFWLIGIYTAMYVLWGLVLGWWAAGLHNRLLKQKDEILNAYARLNKDTETVVEIKKRKTKGKLLFTVFILVFIVLVFAIQGNQYKALYAIARTIAALALLFWIVTPFIQWCIQYWVKRKQHTTAFTQLVAQLPELKGYVKPAMQLAKIESKGIKAYIRFVQYILVLTLYAK
jgi:hypothetical protein